ncbi:hypothetical protein [Methylopila sp. Yamaguchi]|uniref:hypothetical protein n=1 Tax=Methylopila sp. Yamaguchi TaxID=1437817 RepID=UPI000CBD4BE0|nr:hypothetical protein [Methylopila sp. Yamaguchi]GBD50287.1 hypothetical protein METY_3500 [Methylopila sp. Yamaguchi]
MDAAIGTLNPSAVTRAAPVMETAERESQPNPSPTPSAASPELASERRIELDYETGSLIYRMIDVTSGVTVRQTPDEARLKLRAYIDGIDAPRSDPSVQRLA